MPTGQQPGSDGDPFEDLSLDEAFVRSASKREEPGEVRAARAAALRARLEAEQAESARARSASRRARRLRRFLPTSGTLVGVVVLSIAVGIAWIARGGGGSLLGGDPILYGLAAGERPTPAAAVSDQPLGRPATPPRAGESYRFVATQPGSSEPVAYDPCRTISVVVNERHMPPAANGLVSEALAEVTSITGLQFDVEGTTDEVPAQPREPFQPDRYGDRWAPVLIAWSDADEHRGVAGNVAGVGGSQATMVSPTTSVFVTGIVVLDGEDLGRGLEQGNGWDAAKAVVLHELGHLVGLAHVREPGELMSSRNDGLTRFGPGDLNGLARLGRGRCFPEI